MTIGQVLNRSAWVVLLAIGAGTAHSIVSPVQIDRDTSRAPTVLEMPSGGVESDAQEQENEPGSTAAESRQARPGPLVLEADVSVETAARAYDAGVTFVDARTPAEYEAGHISGAYLLNPSMFNGGIPAAVEFLAPSEPIIVYCVGGACTDSDAVVIALESLGFESLHVFKAGYPAWVEAGLPVEDGPDPFAESANGY